MKTTLVHFTDVPPGWFECETVPWKLIASDGDMAIEGTVYGYEEVFKVKPDAAVIADFDRRAAAGIAGMRSRC